MADISAMDIRRGSEAPKRTSRLQEHPIDESNKFENGFKKYLKSQLETVFQQDEFMHQPLSKVKSNYFSKSLLLIVEVVHSNMSSNKLPSIVLPLYQVIFSCKWEDFVEAVSQEWKLTMNEFVVINCAIFLCVQIFAIWSKRSHPLITFISNHIHKNM